MKKKLGVIVLIVVVLCFGYWIFIVTRSSGAFSYSSVSAYVKENGDCFYDFYDPEIYFNPDVKKQTLKEKDNIKIYHQKDPKDYYSIDFKKVKDAINLNIIVDRTMEEDYELDSREKKVTQDKEMYIEKNQNRISIVYPQKDNYINVIFEYNNQDEKEITQLIDIGCQMIIDSIKLNV